MCLEAVGLKMMFLIMNNEAFGLERSVYDYMILWRLPRRNAVVFIVKAV